MSFEINETQAKAHRNDYLSDLDDKLDTNYQTRSKTILDANKIAMNVYEKSIKKDGLEDKSPSNQTVLKEDKKSFGSIIGSIVKGVFGSQKKQQEELRRLESEVKALDQNKLNLDSDLAQVSLNSALSSVVSGSLDSNLTSLSDNHDGASDGVSDSDLLAQGQRENRIIDQKTKLNANKALKRDRITELRKKGVK